MEYVNSGSAWNGKVGWLSVNSLGLDPSAAWAPSFYYEGYVQGELLPALYAGGFWENAGGFQAGPRLQVHEAFVQIGLVNGVMVFVGAAHSW